MKIPVTLVKVTKTTLSSFQKIRFNPFYQKKNFSYLPVLFFLFCPPSHHYLNLYSPQRDGEKKEI